MQENEKIIRVRKEGAQPIRTRRIWQYDKGHVLVFEDFGLPETFQVHFAQSADGEARPWVGQNDTCRLPDAYTQSSGTVYAWVYVADLETGLTKCQIEIPVESRGENMDEEPTPVQDSALDQAIAALNDGVTRAEAAQAAAEGAQAGAERYAESAGDSAITAGDAARAAAASETAAAGSASAAATSAQDALASREGADQSATAAGVSERAAKASETAAAGSASAAAGSATAAAGSASQAAGYASTAMDNARAAAGSATAADTSARAAAGSAADSQQSAQAAAAIAQGAAASAAAADGSATEAAGSASQAAGSASAAAGSATTAATSAQEAAQIAAGIETAGAAQVAAVEAKGAEVIGSIPADYSELSGDVNSLKSAIDELEPKVDSLEINKADVIISSASGSIASFQDGADSLPVKELVVGIEPVQDLHGYDHPWPAGGGQNVFAFNKSRSAYTWSDGCGFSAISVGDAGVTVNGTASSDHVFSVSNFEMSLKAGKYVASISHIGLVVKIISSGTTIATIESTDKIEFTLPEDRNVTFSFTIASGSSFSNQFIEVYISPYSNICPISGWDSVKVTMASAFTEITAPSEQNVNGVRLTKNQDNSSTIIGTCTGNVSLDFYRSSGGFPSGVEAGKKYVVYIQNEIDAFEILSYKGVTPTPILSFSTGSHGVFTIPDDATGLLVRVLAKNGVTYNVRLHVIICPYDGFASIPITFPSEAGTVYGGELTVNEDGTGTVVVDRVRVDLSTKSWTWSGAYASHWTTFTDIVRPANNNAVSNILGEQYRSTTYLDITDINGNLWAISGRPSDDRVYVRTDGTQQTTPTGYVIYPVNTGVTYTLTASQVTTLLGTNNVWADAGDVSVSYRADTKLYIDGKITEAIANALNA